MVFPRCGSLLEWWSNGALKNIKSQAANLKVSGVGCQVSGVRCQGRKTKTLKPEH
jgi:hypothetical protein